MILHIPHSGTNTFNRNIEQFDLDYLTDWYTNELFQHKNSDRLVQKYSRFVCDVERFKDKDEPMFKVGQGICYTKGTRDNDIEVINKKDIIKNIYDVWHKDLNKLVNKTLSYIPKVVLVDCHSFPNEDNYPDFCIGTTEDTPRELVNLVINFIKNDYTARENYPYSGAMYPNEYKGDDVLPLMIEVNKRLYLDGTSKNKDFNKVKKFINELLDVISDYEMSLDSI